MPLRSEKYWTSALPRATLAHGLNVGIPCGIQVPATENNGSIMPMGVNLLS